MRAPDDPREQEHGLGGLLTRELNDWPVRAATNGSVLGNLELDQFPRVRGWDYRTGSKRYPDAGRETWTLHCALQILASW